VKEASPFQHAITQEDGFEKSTEIGSSIFASETTPVSHGSLQSSYPLLCGGASVAGYIHGLLVPGALPNKRLETETKGKDKQMLDDAEAVLITGMSHFTFDLYQKLSTDEENLFFSPFGILLAMVMAYAGACKNTEQQMTDALHFRLPQSRLHPAMKALRHIIRKKHLFTSSEDVASRYSAWDSGVGGIEEAPFWLNVANAIWIQKGYNLLPEFFETLKQNYGAKLQQLDFINNPETSRQTINAWVGKETLERIQELLPPGSIDALTKMLLTNAIYFKATWNSPFEEDATKNKNFSLLNGGKVKVPMMQVESRFFYTSGRNYQAIELPYKGLNTSMVIILPSARLLNKAEKFKKFEQSLTSKKVNQIMEGFDQQKVKLFLPKFSLSSPSFSLVKTFKAMGMPDAFDPNKANFSKITGNRDLAIYDVIHKAFIGVDEKGTEASAATAVLFGVTAAHGLRPRVITMKINRPFVFFIQDVETGTILFTGRVVNPKQ
jgi:serpin B